MDELLMHERMVAWDNRGYQAQRIGNANVVSSVVGQFESYRIMTDQDLQKTWKEIGLPEEATFSRNDVLSTLKNLLVWESLPLAEVQKECRARNLQTDVEDKKSGTEQCVELVLNLKIDLIVR